MCPLWCYKKGGVSVWERERRRTKETDEVTRAYTHTHNQNIHSIDISTLTGGSSHQPIRRLFPLSPSTLLLTTAADITVLLSLTVEGDGKGIQVVWRREEALAGVGAVAFVDYIPAAAAAAASSSSVAVGGVNEKEARVVCVCVWIWM